MSSSQQESESKRKRLTQACELCRRKKIKCDGGKPNCSNCTRLNVSCTYSTNNKKRGPRQGYIEMLEQRLAKMEKILLSAESIKSQTECPEEEHEEEEEYPLLVDTHLPNHQSSDNRPTVGSKRSSEEMHEIATSPISYSSRSSSFSSPNSHMMAHTQHSNAIKRDCDLLPSDNIIEHCIDLFFQYLYCTMPIFDQETLRNEIREKKRSEFFILSFLAATARFSDHPEVAENPPWHAGEKYAEKARSLIIKNVDEPSISNIEALLLLCVHEYGCGRGPRSWMYGGMVMRMAMEIGLHEDMEEEEVNSGGEANKTWSQEYRRRLFWVIFTVDKISSAATGKPPSLLDTYCTAFLPSSDSFKSNQYYAETLDGSRYIMNNINGFRDSQLLNANSLFPDMGQDDLTDLSRRGFLSTFAYFVRVIDLLGKVTSYLNFKGKQAKELLPPSHPGSEFQQLDKALDDWYEKLPMHLKNSPANFELYKDTNQTNESRTFIMMHIAHNTLIVLLHRPSLVVADTLDSDLVQSEIKQFVTKSVEKCMAAVDNVTVLLKEIGNCRELMPPFLTYFAYTVATVIVSSSFSPRKEEAQKAKQALGIYFQLLLSARGLWAMADKLYFMIRDLYAIHSNVLRRRTSMDTSSKLSPSSAPLTQPLFSQPSSFAQPPLDQQLQMPSTTLADWTQPYYLNALSNPLTNTSDQDTTSSVFQIPQGYNEPFGFSPISYGKSNDNNHHGL